jgi:hypothetical protein
LTSKLPSIMAFSHEAKRKVIVSVFLFCVGHP